MLPSVLSYWKPLIILSHVINGHRVYAAMCLTNALLVLVVAGKNVDTIDFKAIQVTGGRTLSS